MIKITVIFVGQSNEQFVKDGLEKYKLLLSKYCSLDILELQDVKNASKLDAINLKKQEAFLISKHIPSKAFVTYLDEVGEEYNSINWAKKFEKMSMHNSHFCFVVGGAFGLDYNNLIKGEKWALSKLTFTHQMVRIILLEQLYRQMTIIKGTTYHHI